MSAEPTTHTPTIWTRRLQILVAVCSLIFTIETAIQNFVIVDLEMLEHTMQLAGSTPAEAADDAPGFLFGFRIVGTLFIIGNALGMLALTGRNWVFWLALVVNIGQAAGVVMIPPEVFEATNDIHGPAGLLPTIVTDGGALLLVIVLIASYVKYRTPWARARSTDRRSPATATRRRSESST